MAKGFDIRVIRSEFDDALNRLKRYSFQSKEKITKDAAEAFIRSATNATAPCDGRATISNDKYERPVIELERKTKTGKELHHYYVPYRTARKRGRKYWITEQAARAFAKIKYRGLGRAGWFLGLLKIGRSLTAAHKTMLRKAPDIERNAPNSVAIKQGRTDYAVTITNATPGISGYAQRSEIEGLRKAKNKMNAAAKQYEMDLKKLFR